MSTLHQRAKDVFLAALACAPADRDPFLADACGTDTALRQEVESLLAFHEEERDHDTAQEPTEAIYAPGQIFAGRYRMITRPRGHGRCVASR
jgi:hypothetical protein